MFNTLCYLEQFIFSEHETFCALNDTQCSTYRKIHIRSTISHLYVFGLDSMTIVISIIAIFSVIFFGNFCKIQCFSIPFQLPIRQMCQANSFILIAIFFEAVIVLMCNYFPKLLKTHFFIYFVNISQPFR